MAYAKRYAGGFADNAGGATPIDSVFLNAVETALLELLSADGSVDGQVMQWIQASSKFGPALLLNKNVDAAAAIAKSKLDFTGGNGIVNADIAGSAAIAKSKLAALGIVDADVANAAAIALSKLADPGTGNVLTSAGAGAIAAKPPGYEFDYKEVTTDQTSTATSTATATAIITSNAVTFDGSTVVLIEFFVSNWELTVTTQNMILSLYDGATELGTLATMRGGPVATQENGPLRVARRLTPSAAAHTYSIRASVSAAATATFKAGAGTIGVAVPMFTRITKA